MPIEQDSARRPQRQLALVIVLRHLLELRMLNDLEEPEAHGEQRKQHDGHDLKDGDARRQRLALFWYSHGGLLSATSLGYPIPRTRNRGTRPSMIIQSAA